MYISTEIGSFKKYGSNEEILKLLKDCGFDAYDFSMFFSTKESLMFCDDYAEKAKKLRAYADEIGIVCNQAHAPFPVHRAASRHGEQIQAEMEKAMLRETGTLFPKHGSDAEYYNTCVATLIKRCIEITGILGGKAIVIHPDSSVTTEQNVEFYHQFEKIAQQNHVKIALENMWRWDDENNCASLAACTTVQNFTEHLQLLDKNIFVACVDIGHAEMMGNITNSKELLCGVKDRLFCLHVHDNDRYKDRHQVPFSGSIDFDAVATTLAQIGYTGDLTLECDTFIKHFDKSFFPVAAKYMCDVAKYLRDKILFAGKRSCGVGKSEEVMVKK